MLIDGVSNDLDAVDDFRGDYSPDAIGEFQVMSSQYSAEYGQASGAIINVVTRSGGNDLHARAAGYYRADSLGGERPLRPGEPEHRGEGADALRPVDPQPLRRRPDHQGQAVLLRLLRADVAQRDGRRRRRPDPARIAGPGLGHGVPAGRARAARRRKGGLPPDEQPDPDGALPAGRPEDDEQFRRRGRRRRRGRDGAGRLHQDDERTTTG